jgi:hypothetical protein
MRTVACLASLCIGCALGSAAYATPTQHSIISARGSQTKHASRDHYRYKKYYQNGQRANEPVQGEPSTSGQAMTILPADEAGFEDGLQRAPFLEPAVTVPTLQL